MKRCRKRIQLSTLHSEERRALKKRYVRLLAAAIAGAAFGIANAAPFEDAVSKTVLTNPDVLAKWHQFRASVQERQISWGRYLPTLDLLYGSGYEHRDTPLYAPPGERHYDFDTAKATLRQNLYEGFATVNDTKRLEHASMVRFYEMLDVSEQAAFEATKAYIDLWRYRQLTRYAEENYATHRLAYEKIKQRAASGVGRNVDLETAAGRLALAESNLLTETSNLHDVTARFQRLTGSLPPTEIDTPPQALFGKQMPTDHAAAISATYEHSPQLKAALENLYSASRQVDVQKSAYAPRVDAYLERLHESDTGGYPGPTKATTVGVTVTWNLFNGKRDSSREREAIEQKNAAKDDRERVCREVRQNSSMSFNEQKRLTSQLEFLDQHQLSTDKEREAFRRQFDIGQRTLLDVLDIENEYYTARRNYLNGENDLAVAQAKYLAVSGRLLETLKLTHLEALPFNPDAASDESLAQPCPPEPVAMPVPPAPPTPVGYVVLLENPDGTTGKVIIKGNLGEQTLEHSGDGAPLDGSGAVAPIAAAQVKQDFSDAMAARPVLPEHFTLRFENGSAQLTQESLALFPQLIEGIANHTVAEIDIIGHTDTTGTEKRNEALGLKRAKLVAAKIKAHGIKVQSLMVESRGEHDLLVKTPDATPEPRNRRVEIRVR